MTQEQHKMYDTMLQTVTAASQLPLVKLDREAFLKDQFKGSPYMDVILAEGPQAVYQLEDLRKKADTIINNMTTQTSLVSFAAGIPSNPFTSIAAGTADVVQYFGFALNLAQQIAYLFGEDDLFTGKSNELPEEAKIRIIAYLGVMFGAGGASALLSNVSKVAGQNLGKKVAARALTKTTWYPLVRKIGTILGQKITKKTVEKTIANSVPLIGGFISGGLTYLTFKPMGEQLANTFVQTLRGDFDKTNKMALNPEFAERLEAQSEQAQLFDAKVIDKNQNN